MQQEVINDDAGMLRMAREIEKWQKSNGYPLLNDLPLEAKVCWAWRGIETLRWSPFPFTIPLPGKITLREYRWNTTSLDTYRAMRKMVIEKDWGSENSGKVVANIEYFFYFNTAGEAESGSNHWKYQSPLVTGPLKKQTIDGAHIIPASYFNVDYSFNHFKKHNIIFGD